MRVLLWGELFWPYLGGAELFAARMMESLRPRGYEFAVVTSHDYLDLPDHARYRDIPIYRFPFRHVLGPRRLDDLAALRSRVAALQRELAPQLIHLNGVGPNAFFCLHAAQSSRTPLLVRLNRELAAGERRAGGDTLLARVLERAAWVVGVSQAMLDTARGIAPGIATRSSLIYNGVASPAAMPEPPPADARRVLCLGRLVRDKGFDLAVASLPALLRRCPGTRLTVAGDGAERAALEQQAAALGVGTAVEFAGWIAPEAVPRVIAAANVVAIPSRSEGLAAVALQAAAMGRPVVAVRSGGLGEIVEHERTGLLVDADCGELANAVATLLEQPARAAQMGAAAWRRARSVFAERRCVDAYDALYRRLAAAAA